MTDRRKELDRRYEELRDCLCRMLNWEPTPTMPAHFYAMKLAGKIDAMYLPVAEIVTLLDATRDFMDKQTPTMAWPDGRPEEAFVFSGKTAKFDQPELVRLFGDIMPIEAVNLVFDAPGNMTLGAVRAKVERMAAAWRARQMRPEQALDAQLRSHGIGYPTGGSIITWLTAAGFVVRRRAEGD